MIEDTISRQAVLDAMSDTWKHICSVERRRKPTKGEEAVYSDMVGTVKDLPPVTPKQTEITLESAIDYLHSIGWLQKHDKELTESAQKQRTGQPCEDAISRQAVLGLIANLDLSMEQVVKGICALPLVKPQYTDDEIKKMQDLEQAEIQKAYELGKAETGHRIDDCSNLDSCENCEYDDGECCRLLYEAKMESEEQA